LEEDSEYLIKEQQKLTCTQELWLSFCRFKFVTYFLPKTPCCRWRFLSGIFIGLISFLDIQPAEALNAKTAHCYSDIFFW